LEEIRYYPPLNIVVCEFFRSIGVNADTGKLAIQSSLAASANPSKYAFKDTGNKISKIISRQTGKRIL